MLGSFASNQIVIGQMTPNLIWYLSPIRQLRAPISVTSHESPWVVDGWRWHLGTQLRICIYVSVWYVHNYQIAPKSITQKLHDDVIKRKHFPRYWPSVRGIHRSIEFPTQRPVTRSFDVSFDLRLNKRLSKLPWGWWFETPSWSLWRHRNAGTILCEHKKQWVWQ